MPAPQFSLPVTGTSPKATSKEILEGAVQRVVDYLYGLSGEGVEEAALEALAARDEAILYDGPKVESWTELQALPLAAVTAGDQIFRRDIGVTYLVVTAGEHLTTATGIKLQVLLPASGKVSVRAFGAVLDGVVDDTAAFQRAVDSGLPLGPAQGIMRLSDTILVDEKTFIDFEGGATVNDNANFAIHFEPASKIDVFAWKTAPTEFEYRFGTVIGGFAIRGYGSFGIRYVFNLPNSFGCKYDANAYAGFDTFARIVRNLKTVYTGSAHGTRVSGSFWENVLEDPGTGAKLSHGVSTTTEFNVYVSGAPVGHIFGEFSASACTISGITESCGQAAIGATGNGVYWKSYLENTPSANSGVNCFEWGLTGSSAVYDTFITFDDTVHYGTNVGDGSLNTFLSVGRAQQVIFWGTKPHRFGSLLKTTAETSGVSFFGPAPAGVPLVANPGDIHDMAKINFFGMTPYFGALTEAGEYTEFGVATGNFQLFPKARGGARKGQIYLENTSDSLVYRRDNGDYSPHMPPLTTTELSNWVLGNRTVPNEMVMHGENGNGLPTAWRASHHGVDVALTLMLCTATAGSPVINYTGGVAPFYGFNIGDWVTVSAGYASPTVQRQIVGVAAGLTSITLDSAATSTVTDTVTIVRLAHDLQPIGQQGYRSGAATPVGSIVPQIIGERYLDTSGAKKWWSATGLTSADWV